MQDYLLELGKNPLARRLVKRLRLPVNLPVSLVRDSGPFAAQPLSNLGVVVLGDGPAAVAMRRIIAAQGAFVLTKGEAKAVVLDATELADADALGALHASLQPLLVRPGVVRIVIVGLAEDSALSAERGAAQAALGGFVRSLAKELGRHGATVNLLALDPALELGGAEGELLVAAPLGFLLSKRSAFISGQTLGISTLAGAAASSGQWTARSLDGKQALVTGAAQGIGAAVARQLAAEGAGLWLIDHPGQQAALDEVARELGAKALAVDLLQPDAADAIAQKVAAAGARIDVLVNNAGITRDKTLARMKRAQWDDVVAVNLRATMALTRALLSAPREPLLADMGRVVCLSSISGIAGNAGQTNYAAAKAGIAGFTRALARELAPRGVTVNAIAPGFIATRMTHAIPMATREVARRFNALNQAGLPGDVADAIAFLASPGAQGVTGATLRVCGQNLVGS